MANTYSKIYFHVVFAVRNRRSLIAKSFNNRMYEYMSGIITNHGHKLIRGNGYRDHVHLLIGCKTTIRLDELIKEVKEHSSKFITANRYVQGKFNWQSGYAAFSVSRWDLDKICHYIETQEEHHRKKTFQEEYMELLKLHDIEFDPKYIFYDPSVVED